MSDMRVPVIVLPAMLILSGLQSFVMCVKNCSYRD